MIGSDGDLGTMADGAFSMTLGATSVLAGLTTKTTIFLADMILVSMEATRYGNCSQLYLMSRSGDATLSGRRIRFCSSFLFHY